MRQISVVTYNLLSKPLCTAESFAEPDYSPGDLLYENRYGRTWVQLDRQVAKRAVICLQEVDSETSCRLQIDFKKRNYDFYYHPYGTPFNGYMGIAIAVPTSFNVKRVDRFRLVDGKEWPIVRESYLSSFLRYATLGYLSNSYEVWSKARNRFNFMLTIEIEEGGDSVFVSTVHLPCAFKNPSTMITSATLAVQHVQQLAGGSPYILTGDFNITPNTEPYRIITEGKCNIDAIRNDYPAEDLWNPNQLGLKPMRSAVKAFHGVEPDWTNFSISGVFGPKKALKLTLDYIFVSDHFRVMGAFRQAETNMVCPNSTEPSDHVMVWADLEWDGNIVSKL
jgi:endonuclease/exonuclease/phosphatase family metal-dependent hydrolase